MTYYQVKIHETLEIKEFPTKREATAWALKVAHTLAEDITYSVTKVVETTTEHWATYYDQKTGKER